MAYVHVESLPWRSKIWSPSDVCCDKYNTNSYRKEVNSIVDPMFSVNCPIFWTIVIKNNFEIMQISSIDGHDHETLHRNMLDGPSCELLFKVAIDT